jgi:hypothetical protein
LDIALARADAKKIASEPNAQRVEVEHALIVTLKKQRIVLPQSIMTVMKDFRPKFPMKAEKPGLPVIIH